MKYKDIIGQQHIKEHFQSAVVNKTISHAYIINGEKSSGKGMLAETFAMSIMCEASGSEPCMECESCRRIANNSNSDVIKVVKDSKKKSDILGIDEIRHQVIDSIYERPYSGDHKVYIIDNADNMNIPAQNAILKTLEEPPEYAVIILLTKNVERLLPTIISRCIILNMRPVEDSIIKQYLREQDRFLETNIDTITAMACGNVGKAKLLSEDADFNAFQSSIIDILSDLPKTGYRRVLEDVKVLCEIRDKKKYSAEEIFDLFTLWFRDILLYKATGEVDDLIFKNKATEIALSAGYFRFDAIGEVIKLIDDARGKIRSFIKFEAVMELLLINIQETSK